MPNWAMNKMTITGTPEVLNAIMHDLTPDGLTITYGLLIPAPAHADVLWAHSFWGTKWDACHSSITRNTEGITVEWDSPWCTPLVWLTTLVVAHPDATFDIKSGEPGMNVHLEYHGTHGVLTLIADDDFEAHTTEWGFEDWNEDN